MRILGRKDQEKGEERKRGIYSERERERDGRMRELETEKDFHQWQRRLIFPPDLTMT